MGKKSSNLPVGVDYGFLDYMNKNIEEVGFGALTSMAEGLSSDITYWLSTGSKILDFLVSNEKNTGAIPGGRIIEIYGNESTGKSLMAYNIIRDAQRKGGMFYLFDVERALKKDYAKDVLHLDVESNSYIDNSTTLEAIFSKIERALLYLKKNKIGAKFVVFVIDSIAATTTSEELSGGLEGKGYNTSKSKIMSLAFRMLPALLSEMNATLICINQQRYTMNAAPFSDPFIQPGGKALPFHASLRIKLDHLGFIKDDRGNIVGNKVRATVKKSKVGFPFGSCEMFLYSNSGIDDYEYWWELCKKHQIGSFSGAGWVTLDVLNKQIKIQGKEEFTKLLREDQEIRDFIYDELCKKLKRTYEIDFSKVEFSDISNSSDGSEED